MAIRKTTHILKNSDIVNRPLPSTLFKGEPIVNTADGIMYFSGVTTSTSEWTAAGTGTTANFFEVGSNLYDLRLRNQITKYQDVSGSGLVGKFLSGTTNGFVLADISDITSSVDSYVTGATWSPNTLTIGLSNGKPNVPVTIDQFNNLNLYGTTNVNGNITVTGVTTLNGTSYYNNTATASNEIVNYSTLTAYTETNDTYVTGGTVSVPATNNSNSVSIGLTYKNSDGTPRTLTSENTFTTGGTYNNSTTTITFSKNDGTTYGVDLSTIDVNDTFSTGGTVTQFATNSDNEQIVQITGNNGFTPYNITGLTDTYTVSASLIGNTAFFNTNQSLSAYTLDLSSLDTNDTFVTGFTYNDANTFTISRNNGEPNLVATINTVTGLTNTGNLDLQGQLSNSTGSVVINDNLNITGTTTSWGNILPGAHLTYDLGAEGQRWDELWVRKIQIGTTTTTLEETGGNFEMSGNTGNFVFKPALNSTFHSDVLPDADLTRDLGSPSFRWDVYAGNVSATGLTISGLGAGRVVYTNGSGSLTTESGFEYNDSTNLITVGNVNVTNASGTTATIGQGGLIIGSGGSYSTPGVGSLTVHGDLTVFGDTTTISTSELYVEDPQITLNYNPTGNTSSTSVASGIRIQDGDGSGNDVLLTVAQMDTFTGGDVTEYSGANGYSNRAFLTQLNDIVIRNTNSNNGAPDGFRVLTEEDVLDGGSY